MAWRKDFFPEREDEMLAWTRNLAVHISADPQKYNLSQQSVDDYVAAQQQFADAHRVANQPSTRTRIAVSAKNSARKNIERLSRSLARAIGALMDLSRATSWRWG
jgi:hypothetical protein